MAKKAVDNKRSGTIGSANKNQSARPDSATPMRVEINRIRFYENNPRRSDNPEYDRIKASIRARGMDQPLIITARPGEDDFIVQAGGNTRLRILHELYEATSDERFYWAQCLYVPWEQESSVLLAHLRENELRGNLTFMDKAQAVFETKALIAQELNLEEISARRLATMLGERGYHLSYVVIALMGYAVWTLLPVMPMVLRAGLGKPQVEKIRALDSTARQVWDSRGLGDEAAYNEVFSALCRRCDGPDWDLDRLGHAIENEIAEAAEVSIQTIRMEMSGRLAGYEPALPGGYAEDEEPESPVLSSPDQVGGTNSNKEATSSEEGERDDPMPSESEVVDLSVEVPSEDAPVTAVGQTRLTDLKSLRGRAFALAGLLAQHHGIGDLIQPLPVKGLGFVVRDVPDPTLTDALDDAMRAQVSSVWWQLAACAEMTVAPLEELAPVLNSDTVLWRALEAGDMRMLFDRVWTADPGQQGYWLWRQLGVKDWQHFMNLMDNYRQLHEVAGAQNKPLWKTGR